MIPAKPPPIPETLLVHVRRWETLFELLLEAARDSAEFASDQAVGRSRTASLRRLGRAVEACDKAAQELASNLPKPG